MTHGAGIGLVQGARKRGPPRPRGEDREDQPVFAACSNTLRKNELTSTDLDTGVKVVDSGLAEVIRRQEEGWTYIKLSH